MSTLSDKRYQDPDYEEFRDMLDAWESLGGFKTLARHFEVAVSTLYRWCLGVTAPHPLIRNKVRDYIRERVER